MSKKSLPKLGKAAQRIMAGLQEAVDWAEGKPIKVRVHHINVPEVDVKSARKKLGMSQTQFAERFGIPTASIRNWEQGRRIPETPTQILLAIIQKYPKIVDDVLHSMAPRISYKHHPALG